MAADEGPLTWTADGARFTLTGAFTEKADFAGLLQQIPENAVLDVSGIQHINSTGVRAWTQFVAKLEQKGAKVVLERCSVMFMAQVNMIARFAGGFPVKSFLARFACGTCDAWEDVLVDAGPGARAALEGTRPCSKCGGTVELDDLVDSYASFMR